MYNPYYKIFHSGKLIQKQLSIISFCKNKCLNLENVSNYSSYLILFLLLIKIVYIHTLEVFLYRIIKGALAHFHRSKKLTSSILYKELAYNRRINTYLYLCCMKMQKNFFFIG